MCHTCKNHDNTMLVTIIYKLIIGRGAACLQNSFYTAVYQHFYRLTKRNCCITNQNLSQVTFINIMIEAEVVAGKSAGTFSVLKSFKPDTVYCSLYRSTALGYSADRILF